MTEGFCPECSGLACACSPGDYKVVHVYNGCFPGKAFVLILTIGVDKAWRMVDTEHFTKDDYNSFCFSPISIGSFIYWGHHRIPFVLTLDVEAERFYRIPFLEGYDGRGDYRKSYDFLNIVQYVLHYNWKIWAVTDSKVGQWTMLFHINLEGREHILKDKFSVNKFSLLFPYTVLGSQNLVILSTFSSGVSIAYNVKTKKLFSFGSAASVDLISLKLMLAAWCR